MHKNDQRMKTVRNSPTIPTMAMLPLADAVVINCEYEFFAFIRSPASSDTLSMAVNREPRRAVLSQWLVCFTFLFQQSCRTCATEALLKLSCKYRLLPNISASLRPSRSLKYVLYAT